ncbi:Pentatricopeptide repeat [Macleaya cordata]|uniref:Pentatricopeptide repeat n=1 Tax=Macleaya cordata TaxID=56857 RepID=A0A200Q016_MACCD|nr:Pentatricopeptide repeat [Macleaya cordata]
MAIRSIPLYLFVPGRIRNPRVFVTGRCSFTNTSSSAENYWKILHGNGSELNLEKTLAKTRAKLNSSIIEDIIRRCSIDQSLLGLRFFIWAGLQPDYRHSTLMYNKACQLFKVDQRPETLNDVLEAYRKEGCLVSVKTFKVILNLCREAKLAEEALVVLKKMREFNCRPDTTTYNVVIRLFSEKGDMDMALGLMKEMALIDLYPDMITYVSMIKGFCNLGQLENACELIKVMRSHGCFPNVVAYSALLDGVCKTGNLERALDLLGEMENEGQDCFPNVVTYTTMIQSFCEKGRTMEAVALLERMGSHGCPANRVTVSTLIKGLCSEGRIDEAYKLIDKVVADGSVSTEGCYSSLVVSLLQIKNMEEAEKLFRKMLVSGIRPDGLACSSFIKQLCSEGRVLDGFEWYYEMEKKEFLTSVDSDIHSILLVGLCQKGQVVEAAKLVGVMFDRRIQLKAPYVDEIIEFLKRSGETELALRLTSFVGSS